jgi:hypothetical protein
MLFPFLSVLVQLNQNPLVFHVSALFHNNFLPNWPSSGVQGVFKESALLSF